MNCNVSSFRHRSHDLISSQVGKLHIPKIGPKMGKITLSFLLISACGRAVGQLSQVNTLDENSCTTGISGTNYTTLGEFPQCRMPFLVRHLEEFTLI